MRVAPAEAAAITLNVVPASRASAGASASGPESVTDGPSALASEPPSRVTSGTVHPMHTTEPRTTRRSRSQPFTQHSIAVPRALRAGCDLAVLPSCFVLREAAYDRLFPRWRPPGRYRPMERAQSNSLRIEWLGTAGHVVSTAATTLLIDPYVTRVGLARLGRRIVPDEAAIARWIPERVDAVVCGHSHFDHLLDAPHIALRRGAKLVGSRTTCSFARASGVPDERIVQVPPQGASLRIGDIDVRFVPSLHARILFGRVPFDGEVARRPRLPARAWDYKMGGALGILLDAAGVRVYHNGSADLVDAELAGLRADVVLMGLAGRQVTRGYVGRLLDALCPRVVIPTHHDAFFAPLEDGLRLLPRIDLEGWVREVEARATVILPDYGETVQLAQGAQGASIAFGA